MKTYHKSVDHLILAVSHGLEGRTRKAAAALDAAFSDPEVETAIKELAKDQEAAFHRQGVHTAAMGRGGRNKRFNRFVGDAVLSDDMDDYDEEEAGLPKKMRKRIRRRREERASLSLSKKQRRKLSKRVRANLRSLP